MANPLLTTNSSTSNLNQVNSLIREVNNDQKVRVIKDETGTPVLILDKNGLRTTAPGSMKDVTNASEDDYTFNSARNLFKITYTGNAVISPFNVAANSTGAGSVTVTFPWSDNTRSPIVLAFTDSLPSDGLYLWQGVSPESTMSSVTSSPMGFITYIRFDTSVSPGSPNASATMAVNVRNASSTAINGITYDLQYFVLTQSFAA